MTDDVITSGQGPKRSEAGAEEGDALVFFLYIYVYTGHSSSDAHLYQKFGTNDRSKEIFFFFFF